MKRFSILLLFSLSAFGQTPPPPPVIDGIVPATGPAIGSTTVTIAGKHFGLPPDFACILPCPPKVTFGDAPAALKQDSDTALVVQTPPHAAGGVNVTVTTGDGRTVTAPNAFLYTDTTEAGYERILLPVYLEDPAPGSNGSLWKTQLWLRNNGVDGVTLAPWTCPFGALCPPVFPLTRTLQPGETIINLPHIDQLNAGRVLYVTREGASSVSTGLRLYEFSRNAEIDAGTEIPVVRETELLTGPAHLHGIPVNPADRVMLRIYEIGLTDAAFNVRVIIEKEGTDSGEVVREFEMHAVSPETAAFRSHPAYAQDGAFVPVPSPVPSGGAQVRVDIAPLTEGSRYWALVSITNNATQRVTLVTPQ